MLEKDLQKFKANDRFLLSVFAPRLRLSRSDGTWGSLNHPFPIHVDVLGYRMYFLCP